MRNEVEKVKVVEIFQTCGACPSQWEGKTDDGQYVYVRYRWGHLSIGIGKTINDAISGPRDLVDMDSGDALDGFLTFDDLVELTSDSLDWSSAWEQEGKSGGHYSREQEEAKGVGEAT